MIKVKKYSEIEQEIKDKIVSYIESEFGNIQIVQQTEWAKPDWSIIYYKNEEIASFYNIVNRNILIDEVEFKAAGISNVITPVKFRGRGYATEMLNQTKNFLFNKLSSDLGILFCADEVVSFYERLNWYKINCPVSYDQPDGVKLWDANTMLLTKNNRIEPQNKIELNGLPW